MIYDALRAGVPDHLLKTAATDIQYGNWNDWQEGLYWLSAHLIERTHWVAFLGCPDTGGDIRASIQKLVDARVNPKLREEIEALENLDACKPGRRYVESCGGIVNAWRMDDMLSEKDDQEWLIDALSDHDIDLPDTVDASNIQGLLLQANTKKQLEKCDDCGEWNCDPDAETYSKGWAMNIGYRQICGGCFEDNYSSCEHCEEYVLSEECRVVQIPARFDRRWRPAEEQFMCDFCAQKFEREAEKEKEALDEEMAYRAVAEKLGGFGRWLARNFDGGDGRPEGATIPILEWIGQRSLGEIWEELKTSEADPTKYPEYSMLEGRKRFVSFLTHADDRAEIMSRFPGEYVESVRQLATLFSAHEWARYAVRTVRKFEALC